MLTNLKKTYAAVPVTCFLLFQLVGCGSSVCTPNFKDAPNVPAVSRINSDGSKRLCELAIEYADSNPTINRTRILGVIPDDTSVEKVLGSRRKVTPADLQLLDDSSLELEKLNDAIVTRRGDGLEILDSSLTGDPGELVVLIGHSEETKLGRKFYFPNGQGYRLEAIHEYARERNTQLIILTCMSPDINAYRALSISEATSIAKKLQALSEAGATKDDLARLARSELVKSDAKVAICYVLATGSGAGAVVSLFDDEEN